MKEDGILDIAFLCGIFPGNMRNEIMSNSRGNVQNAANELQKAYIRGLEKVNHAPVKLINAPFLGSYPRNYKKAYVKKYRFSHTPGAKDISVGFFNVTGINNYHKALGLEREAEKWAGKDSHGKKKVLLAYSATYSVLRALSGIKRKHPEIITCLIAPDLPQYMNFAVHSNLWYYLVNQFLISPLDRYLKQVDTFVVLTRYFAERLPMEGKPYVIIEGICRPVPGFVKEQPIKTTKNKVLLYTGSLERQYGIIDLIKAFLLIPKKNYELWICGSGNARNYVMQAEEKDPRIKYFGQVTYSEALALQQQADVLINPRSGISGEYTKYSFPSKTLEYLASGKPVLMKRLPGIPEEYYKYVYIIPDGPTYVMSVYIELILSLPKEYLEAEGMRGREFVLTSKNQVTQCGKVLKMLLDYRTGTDQRADRK